tara:strand:- start:1264 stop:1626 length:363 start_codon:yes stop_codon:yes gene_type:complete
MMASEDCSHTCTDDGERAFNPKEDKTHKKKDLFFVTTRLRTYKTLNSPLFFFPLLFRALQKKKKNLRRIRETRGLRTTTAEKTHETRGGRRRKTRGGGENDSSDDGATTVRRVCFRRRRW